MKVHFLSISLFTSIPSLRFIVDSFLKNKNEVAITELSLKNSNNHFANKNIEHNIIAEFENFDSLKSGLKKIFFKKYITIFKVLLSKSNDIIYTNDFQVVFFKILLNKKSKLIYHQFELIESNYLGKFGKIIYNYILKNANKIELCVFPEENRANYFIRQCDIELEKVILIPNSCKPVITINSDEETCIDFIPANTFKVLHTGVLGVAEHYFDTFLSATKMFNSKDNIAFIFIGRKTKEIDKFIEDNNITNVHFINNIPHQELLKVYSKVDLGLILYKGVNLNIEYCAPNKLYEFWSNGVPVLAHQLKGLQPLFNNKVLGELTDFNSIDLIYATIQKLKGEDKNNKQKLIEYFNNHLGIDLYISKLEEQIEKIFKD